VVVVEIPRLVAAEAEAATPTGELVIAEAAEPEVIRKGKVVAEESE
jgi:hypothetical protein